jgi:hypothetical protein
VHSLLHHVYADLLGTAVAGAVVHLTKKKKTRHNDALPKKAKHNRKQISSLIL